MKKKYTSEVNAQIIVSLLKQHGINKVIASPGTTNMAFVASVQQDSWFQVYSSVDERSAGYIACGMASESGEAVVLSCTGATASRNYLPGLTEAYYRKLPILAITSHQGLAKVSHHIPQVIDRSQIQHDIAKLSVVLQIVKDAEDQWDCEIKANRAILELWRHGGGPVHINLETRYSRDDGVDVLPEYRKIQRFYLNSDLPAIQAKKVGIFVGSHRTFSAVETRAIEAFCEARNGAVFCDHTSGYQGKFRLQITLLAAQTHYNFSDILPELVIHIGEVSGDYYIPKLIKSEVWRVSEDGELRDTFKKLKNVFEMPLASFFRAYEQSETAPTDAYWQECRAICENLRTEIPSLPFSNIWTASKLCDVLPVGSTLHFAILNSLRAWNFFEIDPSITSSCNVGGFGIDGGMSSAFGASQVHPDKLYFLVIGDLAFFYDMNVLGNRHLKPNFRILLVNNGKGVEFRQHGHVAEPFGEAADEFISAAGHFGRQSAALVKHYAEDLGFEYLTASDKEAFLSYYSRFVTPEVTDRPMLFEVFTKSEEESQALEIMMNLSVDPSQKPMGTMESMTRKVLGKSGIKVAKKILGR